MPDPTTPRDGRFGEWMREMERRISALERSARLPFSSTRGGQFVFLDDNGTRRFAMGNVDLGPVEELTALTGGYGVFMFDEHGALIFGQKDGFRGQLYPTVPLPMHDASPKTTNSTSFTTLYECTIPDPTGDVVEVFGVMAMDAGTTGQLRLTSDTATTSALSIGDGGSGGYQFQWIHPGTAGIGDPRPGRETSLYVGLQARVTSGSGSITVGPPQVAEIASSWLIPDADTNGNPQLL